MSVCQVRVIIGFLALNGILLCCHSYVSAADSDAQCNSAQPKVEVEHGSVQGEQLKYVVGDGNYISFKGIPYAAPPIGDFRFLAPQPLQPWEGVRNATSYGSSCIQLSLLDGSLTGEEDCLFLNVYTASLCPKEPLPVMVFIHGGGFVSGSGNNRIYGPDFLVQHGVVLVTLNYRLDFLGLLSLDTKEVPGNAALKDQVAALKWVQNNIAKFGGNPKNVTLFGHSSGAATVILHVISPLTKGLFTRAISMSGVPSCDWAIPYEPRRRAFVLGKQLGIDTEDPKELLTFLRNVPAKDLVGKKPNVLTNELIIGNELKMSYPTPVVEKNFGDKHFLITDPDETFKKDPLNVDLMIGTTDAEGILEITTYIDSILATYPIYADLLVPRKILYNSTSHVILEISDMIRDHFFGNKSIGNDTLREFLTYDNESSYWYDIDRLLKKITKLVHSKLYVYKFSAVSNRNIFGSAGAAYGLTGASHGDDIAYLFDPKFANLTIEKNSTELKLINQTCTLFTNFAKYGNPTPDKSLGLIWPEYQSKCKSYMEIGNQLKIGEGLFEKLSSFWATIFKKAGFEF